MGRALGFGCSGWDGSGRVWGVEAGAGAGRAACWRQLDGRWVCREHCPRLRLNPCACLPTCLPRPYPAHAPASCPQTSMKVEEGVRQLEKAEKRQKQGGMALCIILLLCAIVVVLLLVVFKAIFF